MSIHIFGFLEFLITAKRLRFVELSVVELYVGSALRTLPLLVVTNNENLKPSFNPRYQNCLLNCQLSTINYQLSTINYQLSTI
ncbi:MAG: hypothetical protein HC786_12860 [Richelia sp. CSU_2_1]|nr:hypothetical protein [Microcoleus sp. SU_5_6]NJR22977.1 hypothetical protein [Richelia sp. CSU_2_1]